MTCREKLKIEHPEKVGNRYKGGCNSCPYVYGYLPNPDYCEASDSICTACWDREIPEEKCEAVEQEYIRFTDGHSEEITWWDKPSEDTVFVTTESGRYQYYDDGCIPRFSKFSAEKICYETVVDIIYMVVGGEQFGIKPREFDGMDEVRELTYNHTTSPVVKTEKIEETDGGVTATFIRDSGDRTQFASGAVRDMHEGKGRCDLMPLDVVGNVLNNPTLCYIADFQETDEVKYLKDALTSSGVFHDPYTMFLEVAKHFEEGCKKYGENNWRKGIDVKLYIDSAVRHYLKFLRGDKDEPHDRAFCWNILCCIWTAVNKPELDCYRAVFED